VCLRPISRLAKFGAIGGHRLGAMLILVGEARNREPDFRQSSSRLYGRVKRALAQRISLRASVRTAVNERERSFARTQCPLALGHSHKVACRALAQRCIRTLSAVKAHRQNVNKPRANACGGYAVHLSARSPDKCTWSKKFSSQPDRTHTSAAHRNHQQAYACICLYPP